MCLDFCRSLFNCPWPLLGQVRSPLRLPAWEAALRAHPDRVFSRLLLEGICHGFRIGFNRQAPLSPVACNMQSAREHPEVIDVYIAKECSLGRMLGPLNPDTLTSLPEFQINRFGVIPKGHNTGKWRLITDLSFPPGRSVNDGIAPELCSLTYASVDQVADTAAQLGRGTLMAKIDVDSAYRLILVNPQDRPLQAVSWRGGIYIDLMLPFGLRSAPKIFNAVADALEWHLRQLGVQHIFHYLDDFIILGRPESSQCTEALATLNHSCWALGVPVAEHKRAGPATCLTFLGIEVDTEAAQLRLPMEKLQRLSSLLNGWGDRRTCSRWELESLVGLLNHACKVVRSGRSFLRRMIDLLHMVPMHPLRPHPIRLNREFRSDLIWWRLFVSEWNGVSFLPPPHQLPAKEMATDASGSWGCGAWHGNSWFQLTWDTTSQSLPIVTKELLPIVLACELWGAKWRDQLVRCHCDNQAVVACLRSRTSKKRALLAHA
jgi:hypothetical protein